eukprot:2244636-Pleurochrysis_carterae.AAC.3
MQLSGPSAAGSRSTTADRSARSLVPMTPSCAVASRSTGSKETRGISVESASDADTMAMTACSRESCGPVRIPHRKRRQWLAQYENTPSAAMSCRTGVARDSI